MRQILQACTLGMVALYGSGCMMYMGGRSPDLVGRGLKPDFPSAPRVKIVLTHKHTYDDAYCDAAKTALTFKAAQDSFERVRSTTPFLTNAGKDVARPDYVLKLDTEVAEHGGAWTIITGATFLMVPGFFSSDFVVKAKIETPEGTVVSQREAVSHLKMITHMIFLPFLPITLAVAPSAEELHDQTFRDALIEIADDLKAQPSGVGHAVR